MQFSNGGAAFLAGKGIKNTGEKAAILGAIAGAQHVRLMAKHYGVPVVLHSDHCAKVHSKFKVGYGVGDSSLPRLSRVVIVRNGQFRRRSWIWLKNGNTHKILCQKLLPWFDGMLEANEEYFRANGEPLFSSHMLDLSEEFDEENIATCVKYFKRMAAVKLWLEMEIGITGGEEDGVDNTGVKADALYTKPEQVREDFCVK